MAVPNRKVFPINSTTHIQDNHDQLQPIQESSTPAQGSLTNSDEWLNTEAAAAYLGIPVGTLRNLTSNGHVPYYKVPGTRLNRYLKSELRELLLRNRKGGSHGL